MSWVDAVFTVLALFLLALVVLVATRYGVAGHVAGLTPSPVTTAATAFGDSS